MNATALSGSNSTTGVNVPFGMEAIVAWITKYAELEIVEKCDAFIQQNVTIGNFTNSTIIVSNGTVNSTVNNTNSSTTIPIVIVN
jgi:hypothetical protein